jgi:pre-mRNA-splicing factor ATP-dependent RNA helicase DHX15/PRP43
MIDPTLSKYGIVIIDEAHERTIATDILFGVLKDLLNVRDDLKVVVMSATLDAEKFRDYFDDAPLIEVPGRQYPVEIVYSEKIEQDYVLAAIRTIIDIHANQPAGDILVFMTGEAEIDITCKDVMYEIRQYGDSVGNLSCIPCYSSLPPHEQTRIFSAAPGPNARGIPGRKCVIATNIAETSLTIDGIVYVVDTGLAK